MGKRSRKTNVLLTPQPTVGGPLGRRVSRSTWLAELVSRSNEIYKLTLRSLSALAITETELKLIAALASMGLSSHPSKG